MPRALPPILIALLLLLADRVAATSSKAPMGAVPLVGGYLDSLVPRLGNFAPLLSRVQAAGHASLLGAGRIVVAEGPGPVLLRAPATRKGLLGG